MPISHQPKHNIKWKLLILFGAIYCKTIRISCTLWLIKVIYCTKSKTVSKVICKAINKRKLLKGTSFQWCYVLFAFFFCILNFRWQNNRQVTRTQRMQVTAYNMIMYMCYMYIVKSKCKQQQCLCVFYHRQFLPYSSWFKVHLLTAS